MIPKGFQCKFAVASGQDGEPCCLEQLPDEILYMQIVFNKQNHHRVHINLFNGLKSVALQYDLVPSTPLNIRDRTFADCIVDPERLCCFAAFTLASLHLAVCSKSPTAFGSRDPWRTSGMVLSVRPINQTNRADYLIFGPAFVAQSADGLSPEGRV